MCFTNGNIKAPSFMWRKQWHMWEHSNQKLHFKWKHFRYKSRLICMCLLLGPGLTPGNKCAKWVTFNLETEEQDDVTVFWQIQNETRSYFKEIKWGPQYPSMHTPLPLDEGYFYSFEEMAFKSCSMWTDHERGPKTCILLLEFYQQDAKRLLIELGHFPLEARGTAVLRRLRQPKGTTAKYFLCPS